MDLKADAVQLCLAEREDNLRLCELFKSVNMQADLHLSVERDPDFFALYDLQKVRQRVVTWKIDGRIEGVATLLGRDCMLFGARTPTGYMGDLRYSRALRGGRVLGKYMAGGFRDGLEDFGCELMYTAVITSNKAAVGALVQRSSKYPDKPFYALVRAFTILSVQFTKRRKPLASDFVVRRARAEDIPAIVARLADDHAARPFGYLFDEELLRFRLDAWPEFGIENFFLAFDQGGRLVGVTAPWDAFALKRFRVMGYHGRMRWIKLGFNGLARLLRWQRLPAVGDVFRYLYLTHTSVAGEDPAVMASLLDAVYQAYHGQGYHFFSACLLEGDPLARAYKGYRTNGLPAALFAVSEPGHRYNTVDFGRGRPGLEMALV